MKNSRIVAACGVVGFVFLWGSAGIFTQWGVEDASPILLLLLRYSIAFIAILPFCAKNRCFLPQKETIGTVITSGFLLVGVYSFCYFMAMYEGITPGVLATVLGAQPILTFVISERSHSISRLIGLGVALLGLASVVLDGSENIHLPMMGLIFSLIALCSMMFGALVQKRVRAKPLEVMPLQYLVGIAFYLFILPCQPVYLRLSPGFLVSLLFLGVVISVLAQLLFYRMIQGGNVVNVTSLFYLVPIVTALLDYFIFGHALSGMGCLGLAGILLGMAIVFRRPTAATEY